MLKAAQDVRDALLAAKVAQDAAQAAINNATLDITEAGKDLTTTSNGTDTAEVTAGSSLEGALQLQSRLRDIEKNFTANQLNVQRAEAETQNRRTTGFRCHQGMYNSTFSFIFISKNKLNHQIQSILKMFFYVLNGFLVASLTCHKKRLKINVK